MFVGSDVVHAQRGYIAQGFGQGRTADIVRRTGLELEGQFVECRFLERDGGNHFAATLIGREPFEPFFFPVEDTDTRRPVDLMAGEDIEFSVDILYVHRDMRNGLRAID